jgi:hypothetical protein
VLDSFRSLAPGLDENDSGECERAIAPLRSLVHGRHLPALLLHHTGKSGNEYRGSTAIGAAVELGFALSRNAEDPERRSRRRLACWKCRPAPEPRDRWIKLSAEAGQVLVGETEPFEPSEPARQPAREEIRQQIRELFADGDRRLRLAEIARAIGRPPQNATVRRALEELVDEAFLERHKDGYNRRTTQDCQVPTPLRGLTLDTLLEAGPEAPA